MTGQGRCQCVDVASAEDRVPVVTLPLPLVEHLHASIRSPDPDPPQRILADRRAVVRLRESRLIPHVLPLRLHLLSAQAVDAAPLRRDPQVLRTCQAGSRQELRRCSRKLLRQCRMNPPQECQGKNETRRVWRNVKVISESYWTLGLCGYQLFKVVNSLTFCFSSHILFAFSENFSWPSSEKTGMNQ